jgi:hypothetical protein
MKKYGINNFSIELLEECEENILSDREIFWINYYDSFKNGYNATYGGDGKLKYDYEKVLSLWDEGKLVKEIANTLGANESTIVKILNLKGVSHKERHKRGAKRFIRPLKRISLNGEEKVYNNIEEALQDMNRTSKVSICACCNGHREKAYGYKWEWIK